MNTLPTKPGWWRPESSSGRLWLGLATFWPLLYLVLFAGGMVAFAVLGGAHAEAGPHEPPAWLFAPMAALMAVHCITVLVMLAVVVVYIISIINNPRLDQTMRIVWILLAFLGGMIALPVYWWLHLRTE